MKTILLIEDDAFLKDLESTKFIKEGFSVMPATTRADIDAHLATTTPDIILLDLMLPDVDGFTLLDMFRSSDKTKTVPVIVFSNLSSDADMKKAFDKGANEYMVKSNVMLDEIVGKIQTLLK